MNILSGFEQRTCPVCGVQYLADPKRLKHGRQTTCSRECSYRLRGKNCCNIFGSDKQTKDRDQKAEMACQVCGQVFHPKHKTSKYCSNTCKAKSRRLPVRTCNHCGISFKPFTRTTKYCSSTCFHESHRLRMSGENNPSYIDGRSKNKRCYRGSEWNFVRIEAYKRDGYTCQHCGVKCISRRALTNENGDKLIQCHHINFWSKTQDNSLENLVTLCASCHAKVHFGNIDINEPN